MKKIYSSFIIIASLFSFISCNSFLDAVPTDEGTDVNFWTSEESVEKTLLTLYSATFPTSGIFGDESMSDNAYDRHDWWPSAGIQQIGNGTVRTTDNKVKDIWNAHYASIRKCWHILENIDKAPFAQPETKAVIIAEVRAILAYNYNILVTYYGDVPLVKKRLTVSESKEVSRNSKAEVLAFVHEQIDMAATTLKNGPKRPGHITWETCLAIKARSYLFQNDYPNVLATVSQLKGTGYPLNTTGDTPYDDLFSGKIVTNPEIIFSVERIGQQGSVEAGHSGNGIMLLKGVAGGDPYCAIFPSGSLVDSYPMADGRLIRENGSTYDAKQPYLNRDPRFYQTIIYPTGDIRYYNAAGNNVLTTKYDPEDPNSLIAGTLYSSAEPSSTGYVWNKYVDWTPYGLVKPFNSTTSIIVFRYADILLMEAEALAETKGAGAATEICNLIDRLRDRCKGGRVYRANYTTKESLVKLVRNERRIELANEGLRYFDLIRWKEAEWNTIEKGSGLVGKAYGAMMRQDNPTAPGYGDETVLVDNVKRKVIELRYFNPNKNYLLPIPQKERDLNRNLSQNPGWGN